MPCWIRCAPVGRTHRTGRCCTTCAATATGSRCGAPPASRCACRRGIRKGGRCVPTTGDDRRAPGSCSGAMPGSVVHAEFRPTHRGPPVRPRRGDGRRGSESLDEPPLIPLARHGRCHRSTGRENLSRCGNPSPSPPSRSRPCCSWGRNRRSPPVGRRSPSPGTRASPSSGRAGSPPRSTSATPEPSPTWTDRRGSVVLQTLRTLTTTQYAGGPGGAMLLDENSLVTVKPNSDGSSTIVFVGRGAIWGTDASVGQPFFEWVTGAGADEGHVRHEDGRLPRDVEDDRRSGDTPLRLPHDRTEAATLRRASARDHGRPRGARIRFRAVVDGRRRAGVTPPCCHPPPARPHGARPAPRQPAGDRREPSSERDRLDAGRRVRRPVRDHQGVGGHRVHRPAVRDEPRRRHGRGHRGRRLSLRPPRPAPVQPDPGGGPLRRHGAGRAREHRPGAGPGSDPAISPPRSSPIGCCSGSTR